MDGGGGIAEQEAKKRRRTAAIAFEHILILRGMETLNGSDSHFHL